jgi:hypothetical protein
MRKNHYFQLFSISYVKIESIFHFFCFGSLFNLKEKFSHISSVLLHKKDIQLEKYAIFLTELKENMKHFLF